MNNAAPVGKPTLLVRCSNGANKDSRYFYSTSYSTTFNADQRTKHLGLKTAPHMPITRVDETLYARPRQETGFTKNLLPFVAYEREHDTNPNRDAPPTYADHYTPPLQPVVEKTCKNIRVVNVVDSGFTAPADAIWVPRKPDGHQWEAVLDKDYKILPCLTHQELHKKVYKVNGLPTLLKEVAVGEPDSSAFTRSLDSTRHQRSIFGDSAKLVDKHDDPDRPLQVAAPFDNETLSKTRLNKMTTDAFTRGYGMKEYLTCPPGSVYTTTATYKPSQLQRLSRQNPAEYLNVTHPNNLSTVTHDTMTQHTPGEMRKDVKAFSVGAKEESGSARNFDTTSYIKHESGSWVSETQERFQRYKAPQAALNEKLLLRNSGFARANNVIPDQSASERQKLSEMHPMLRKAHRIDDYVLRQLSQVKYEPLPRGPLLTAVRLHHIPPKDVPFLNA